MTDEAVQIMWYCAIVSAILSAVRVELNFSSGDHGMTVTGKLNINWRRLLSAVSRVANLWSGAGRKLFGEPKGKPEAKHTAQPKRRKLKQ